MEGVRMHYPFSYSNERKESNSVDPFWLGFVIGIGSFIVLCGVFVLGVFAGMDYDIMMRIAEKMAEAKEKKGEKSDD